MTAAGWLQLLALIVLLAVTVPLVGNYMAKVFGGKKAPGDRFFNPVERVIYRLGGIDPDREQRWSTYALALLAFSLLSVIVLFVLQRVQEQTADMAKVEARPRMEGRQMLMVLAPK